MRSVTPAPTRCLLSPSAEFRSVYALFSINSASRAGSADGRAAFFEGGNSALPQFVKKLWFCAGLFPKVFLYLNMRQSFRDDLVFHLAGTRCFFFFSF